MFKGILLLTSGFEEFYQLTDKYIYIYIYI